MKLQTKQFGEIEFDEEIIIEFTDGILGFESFKKYILITEEEGIFNWLTSIDEPEIVFPLFPIGLLQENFPAEEAHLPYGIVKLSKNPGDITINIKSPVYLNMDSKTGFQKIIDSDKYPIDYKLFIEN